MQDINTNLIGRRPVLKGAGVALAGLGGLSGTVLAGNGSGKGAGGYLKDTEAGFLIQWSDVNEDASDPNAGDYNDFYGAVDPGGGEGFFDGSTIRITPNHQTLHHSFQLFAGFLMSGESKPYSLVNLGDGLFESRGQSSNFETPPPAVLESMLNQARLPGELAYVKPLSILAGGKWRAVATERLKVHLDGEAPFDSEWAATRVDIYSRGGGKSEFALSLVYSLWENGNDAAQVASFGYSGQLIAGGRLNYGGK